MFSGVRSKMGYFFSLKNDRDSLLDSQMLEQIGLLACYCASALCSEQATSKLKDWPHFSH